MQTAAREKGLCLHRLSLQSIASTLKSPIFNETDLLFQDGEVRWAAAQFPPAMPSLTGVRKKVSYNRKKM